MQTLIGNMIHGVGIDIISSVRVKKIIAKFPIKFVQKVFSENEVSELKKRFCLDSIQDLEKFFLVKDPSYIKYDVSSQVEKIDKNINSKIINFLSKRFAAKEAFSKAIGLGIGRGIDFHDIEIFNDEMGKPLIRIVNNKDQFIKKVLNCTNYSIHLSLTDEKSVVGAFVVVEKLN